MPTTGKQLSVYLPEALYQAALKKANGRSFTQYVRALIEADTSVADTMVHGGWRPRRTLPAGWRSKLYRDRYQFVAVWNSGEFIYHHLHEYTGETSPSFGSLRVEDPVPAEITVVGMPTNEDRDQVSRQLHLDFLAQIDELI